MKIKRQHIQTFLNYIVSFSSINMVCEVFSCFMTLAIGFQRRGPYLFVFKHFCAINIDDLNDIKTSNICLHCIRSCCHNKLFSHLYDFQCHIYFFFAAINRYVMVKKECCSDPTSTHNSRTITNARLQMIFSDLV